MPVIVPSTFIVLDGTSGEFTGRLDVTTLTQVYYIIGSATAVANYNVSPTGTPQANTTFYFKYTGNLDITTNSVTFTFFGTTITQLQLQKHMWITCVYDGSQWLVDVSMDFAQSGIISAANLGTNSISGSVITNNSIDLHQKGVALSLTNEEIANATIDGSTKLVNNSVPDSKLQSGIDGAKLTDHTVPNAKISTGTASALKVTDSSGNMQDLALGNNQLAIGNGTNVTTINLSSITTGSGMYDILEVPVSFESGEQTATQIYLPFRCTIVNICVTVTKAIAGTDDATVEVATRVTSTIIDTITIPASSILGDYVESTGINFTYAPFNGASQTLSKITVTSSKTTPGGKALVSFVLQRA